MMRCAPSTADEYGAAVPPGQYVRLFSGLRRSTSREYLVLLANDFANQRGCPPSLGVEWIFGQPASAIPFQEVVQSLDPERL
jgi:hypothetical protein